MAQTTIKFASENTILYFWQKIKALLGNKVDKVTGMGLSHNDLTDALVEKINNAGDSSFTGAYRNIEVFPANISLRHLFPVVNCFLAAQL